MVFHDKIRILPKQIQKAKCASQFKKSLAQVSNTPEENGNSNVFGFVVFCAIIGFLIDQSTKKKFLKNESPKHRIISSQINKHLKELKSILKKLGCSEKKAKDRKSHKTFDGINWYQLTKDRCQKLILEMSRRDYNLINIFLN